MRAARLAVGPADLLDGPGGMPGAAGTLGGAGRLARADPYRPWFMTGEPASPWWAA